MVRGLDDYMRAVFAAVPRRTFSFRSGTSKAVETRSATLFQEVSSIHTPFDGRPAALDSDPLITMYSYYLGPGEAPPLVARRIVVVYIN